MRFLAAAALVCGLALPAMGQEEALSPEEMIEQLALALDDAADALDPMAEEIDPAAYEFLPAVENLDFDGETIAAYVAEQIAYEPYDGILRGAQGTLSAGAGNSFDQGLLLIALLQEAGYDAELLEIDAPDEAIVQALSEAAIAQAGRAADGEEPLSPDADISAVAETLSESAEIRGGEPVEFGDYHWVRYRMASGMEWEYAHPALGGAVPDEEPEPDRALRGEASDDFVHRVEISLEAEILNSGELDRETIMSPWGGPVASLFGRSIELALNPTDPESDGGAGAAFLPVLNGNPAPGAMQVSLSGAMIEQGVLEMDDFGMAGVFGALGDQLQTGVEEVRQGPEDQPVRALTGVVMTMQWTAPGGKTRTEERWLLDRLINRGAEDEPPRLDLDITPEDAMAALIATRTIMVQPGGSHREWTRARTVQMSQLRLRHRADVIRAIDMEAGAIAGGPPALDDHAIPFLLAVAGALGEPLETPDGHAVLRKGPQVISLHRSADAGETPTLAIDILLNPALGVREDEHGGLETWPEGAVLRGVADTAIESAFSLDPDFDYVVRSAGAPMSPVDPAVVGDDWPTDARRAAERDLAEGFVLADIPRGEGEPLLWWRVGADGSETLGRHALGGYAQVYTERAALEGNIAGIARGFDMYDRIQLIGELKKCDAMSGTAQACCLIKFAGDQAAGSVAGKVLPLPGPGDVAMAAAGSMLEGVATIAMMRTINGAIGDATTGRATGAFSDQMDQACPS